MRAAAVVSAARSAAVIALSAALNSPALISSATTLGALTRSNSAVYSSTAASPRARTSAMIAATEVSIASSCAVSTAMSCSSADSKSLAAASSLRIAASAIDLFLRRRRPGDRLQQRLHGVALELERGWIDDQARADGKYLLDRDELVGLEGIAAADQIDDRFGEPHQRRQLHRPVQPDQIDVHALGCEMLARRRDVFGGHAQPRSALNGSGVIEVAASGDDHSAAADAEIDGLIEAFSAVLE